MITRLKASRSLWYLCDDENIKHTYYWSLGTVETNSAKGIQLIFLFFNVYIAWRKK